MEKFDEALGVQLQVAKQRFHTYNTQTRRGRKEEREFFIFFSGFGLNASNEFDYKHNYFSFELFIRAPACVSTRLPP